MWSPALAAIVASIVTRRSLKKIGWRPATYYFIGEFGIATVPFTLALSWYCWRRADNIDKIPEEKR